MKPEIKINSTYRKTVRLSLTEEQVQSIIAEWLTRHVPQFRGTNFSVEIGCGDYEGCQFSCTATGTKEKNNETPQ